MMNTLILVTFLLPTYFLGLLHLHLYVMKRFYTKETPDIDINKLREENTWSEVIFSIVFAVK